MPHDGPAPGLDDSHGPDAVRKDPDTSAAVFQTFGKGDRGGTGPDLATDPTNHRADWGR